VEKVEDNLLLKTVMTTGEEQVLGGPNEDGISPFRLATGPRDVNSDVTED
jgi:hypothetical protein